MMDVTTYAQINEARAKGMTWKEIASKYKGVSAGALMQKWSVQRKSEGKSKAKPKAKPVDNGRPAVSLDLIGVLSREIGVARVREQSATSDRVKLERAREIIRGL